MIPAEAAKANPSALPRNGAVHGVARTVAKTPWKNEPGIAFARAPAEQSVVARDESVISKTPKRLSAKTSTTALITTTKIGFVN